MSPAGYMALGAALALAGLFVAACVRDWCRKYIGRRGAL